MSIQSNNVPTLIPDDIVFHVMQFCDFDQLEILMMVSGQWFRQSLKFSFTKSFSLPFALARYGRSYNDDHNKEREEAGLNLFAQVLSNKSSSLLIDTLSISDLVTDGLFDLFSKSINLTRLTSLTLLGSDSHINSFELFSTNSSNLRNLTYLNIYRVRIGDEGFKALASNSSHIKNLTYLRSFWAGNTFQAAKYIAESENFSKLNTLHVDGCEEEGILAFCQSPILSNLTFLEVSHNGSDDVMKYLTESIYLTKLKTLLLDRGFFSPDALKTYLYSDNARNLTDLNFDFSELGNEGMKIIAECPNMSHLRELSIENADVGDDGIQYLLDSKYLNNLITINYFPSDPYYEGEVISEEMSGKIDLKLKENTKNNK